MLRKLMYVLVLSVFCLVSTQSRAELVRLSKEKMNALENSFAELERRGVSLPTSSLNLFWKQIVNVESSQFERKIESIKYRKVNITLHELQEIEERFDLSIRRLNVILDSLKKGKLKSKDYFSYVVSPISETKILPYSIPGENADEVRIIATPGEYESGSFVILPFSDITALKIKHSDLKGEKGIIPSTNVDIKVVKCWYQGETAWYGIISKDRSKKVLVPELLLNDDSLVKVDYEKKENYLKVVHSMGTPSEREEYV